MTRLRDKHWIVAWWLAISLWLTLIFVISDAIVLGHVRPVYLLVMGGLCGTVWVSLAPTISRLPSLVPWSNGPRCFLIHGILSIVFALVCTISFAALMWTSDLLLEVELVSWSKSFRSATFYFLLANAVFYGFVVAGSYLLAKNREVHRLGLRHERAMRELTRARMEVLQGQLQPHFLFNTLNSIASLVRVEKNHKAVEAISLLGDVLRATISPSDHPFTTLESEIEQVATYLRIEQLRFGDRLRFKQVVDPAALETQVPKWILQPLVENALVHGIEKDPASGTIELRAQPNGEVLEISIHDDGVGIADRNSERVGLGNTRRRLNECYGGRAKLELTAGSKGALVQLSIPISGVVV